MNIDKYYYCPTCGQAYNEELAEHFDMKCKSCDTKLKERGS